MGGEQDRASAFGTGLPMNGAASPSPPSVGIPDAAREPNYAAERKLPEGMTCADCRHGHICDQLFGAVRRAFTSCDWWPSRFSAQGIEAAEADETRSGSAEGESPVGSADAPNPQPNPQAQTPEAE